MCATSWTPGCHEHHHYRDNDLDEYALAALQTAPVDSYGVGTMLVTGSGAPTCAMVYKLTEREGADGTMVPVMKKSKDKATVPGRKLAFRSYEYALAEAEHVISGSEEKLAGFTPEPTWKNLLVDFVDHGHIDAQWQGHDAIMAPTTTTPRRCPNCPSPRRAS